LSILVIGPTTNIALAISLDPKFVHKIKRFYVMGGSVTGNGNSSPGVEFNFGSDAESNFIFFNSTRGEVSLLLPWETNLSINISSVRYTKLKITLYNTTIIYVFVLVMEKKCTRWY